MAHLTHEHPHPHPHSAGHAHHRPPHHSGIRGWLERVLPAHSHDPVDAVDHALTASARGIRAVKLSLLLLGGTAALQVAVVAFSGSVALLSDTIHNLGDALTAIPLWIAFSLGRRPPSRTYSYGFGRVEQLAGLIVLAVIAGSAALAGWQAIERIVHPRPIEHLGWVAVAAVIGFLGNELVAGLRIRVGREIGSAALVADGVHARTDGLTSLAVLGGCAGVWWGWPLADPIVGLVIAAAICWLLVGAARDVLRRVLDGVDPATLSRVEHALGHVPQLRVERVRVRWVGLQLRADADVLLDPGATIADLQSMSRAAESAVRAEVPRLAELRLQARPV